MEAAELRIGNFVNIIDRSNEVHLPNTLQVFKIIEIGFDCIICDITKNPLSQTTLPIKSTFDLSPLPLTEEWLLKFGFFSHENRPRPVYGNNSFIYFYKQDGIFWSDLMHGTIEIKYVHQLQNLYFALTGEELELVKENG